MGEHDFRVNIDKVQRDEMLEWLKNDIEMADYDIELIKEKYPDETYWLEKRLRILKSLKAMVESFDTSGKQVEDSGDVRHESYPEQKAVKNKIIKCASKMAYWSGNHKNDFIPDLEDMLKELGIKVTDTNKKSKFLKWTKGIKPTKEGDEIDI